MRWRRAVDGTTTGRCAGAMRPRLEPDRHPAVHRTADRPSAIRYAGPFLAGGCSMQFGQLKRRDLITLLGDLAAGGAGATARTHAAHRRAHESRRRRPGRTGPRGGTAPG